MNKIQWIIFGIAVLITAGLFLSSENKFFGPPKIKGPQFAATASSQFSSDSVLFYAKRRLTPEQATRINFLENSISRGDVKDQKLHIYHQLARFWGDTARIFELYAWYVAEAARLENSEKSLTFAAHLLLDSLVEEHDSQLKQWEAFQAKDLFERSLKLNPDNDSSKIGLGEVIIYGGIAMPMEGIGMIRKVVAKDSANMYAQMSLGRASLVSGQLEKAAEYFKTAASLQPNNIEAIFRAAETSDRLGNKNEAIKWYSRLLPLMNREDIKKDIETRINELKK